MQPTSPPTHPGAIIRLDYLEPLDLSVSALATRLGVSRRRLSNVLNESGVVNADLALRLSRAFKTAPEAWLEMQQRYDLWQAQNSGSGWDKVEPLPGLISVRVND